MVVTMLYFTPYGATVTVTESFCREHPGTYAGW